MIRKFPWRIVPVFVVVAAFVLPTAAIAAPPVVKTVPWVATNALIAHDTYPGRAVTLKGTADMEGANITYRWQFTDGTADATGTVTDMHVIQASHAFIGAVGDIFAAVLTVTNTTTGESGSAFYLVQMRAKSLEVESNIAIDEGLWYLHKEMYRYVSGGKDYGSWMDGSCGMSGHACAGYYGLQADNVNAFFVNGHRVDGLASNPYTETVQRAMRRYMAAVNSAATSTKTYTVGSYNAGFPGPITMDPDCTDCVAGDPSKNGKFLYVGDDTYQMGMVLTALAASGTPAWTADTGGANVVGRTYRAILQDMVDWFVLRQGHNGNGSGFGGWHYGNEDDTSDNSTAQWGAIALLAAEGFGKGQYAASDPGIQIPEVVRQANPYWLTNTFYTTGSGNIYGYFLYQAGYNPWGLGATTPSALMQLVLDRMGRHGTDLKWEKTEQYMRDVMFTNGGCNGVKDYYYGLYAFAKAMLLHVDEATGLRAPITLLGGDFDWYAAEVSKGAYTDGVARTLIGDQGGSGDWWAHYCSGAQYYFETAWAIQILNRTVTESGAPVAVARAIPNPAVTGGLVTLDGTASFHQDPTKAIVKWEWDIGNDGTYDLAGPAVTWTAPNTMGNVQVRLRVTDNFGTPASDDTIITVVVSIPPLAPTANAGGPYNFCPGKTPWFLDASKSVNPDEGAKDPTCGSCPGDTITTYAWDLNNDGVFTEVPNNKTPDVTAYFSAKPVGSYAIRLKVTDRTSLSFPSHADLSGIDPSGQVNVLAALDVKCAGCTVVTGRAAGRQVQLNWTAVSGAAGYAVYRGTASGGPYVKLTQVPGTQLMYIDANTTIGTTYYWVVRPLAANLEELCQSNQISFRIVGR